MRESGIKILALAMAQIGEAKPYVSKICELAWSHDFCIEVDTAHLADILNLADNIETKFCDGESKRDHGTYAMTASDKWGSTGFWRRQVT